MANNARTKLLDGLAITVATKGYSATTIADIVAHAHVSRRTFYEHFADKEECLLACHHEFSTALVDTLTEASLKGETSEERIINTVTTLLATLQAQPAHTKTHFMEMQAAGAEARQARRQTQRSLSDLLQQLSQRGSERNPHLTPLALPTATAIVGGISELILEAAEADALPSLSELHPTITGLITAVLIRA
ncbi:TetR/AcrR family transcriptional regulator [Hoyosella rhizosphaerae]|uniref:TetR family transcriptional regulator n=1 Tax=Hoyosella rhizosphaerae TaxID=1755582 RepID=A0A916XED9_9ACTN|nr:TetR/AcrR family transcriptional regulator [Hoyosella rhizosphaerae]MBN4926083.1 TetR/AcrR family transcriptional regulator [Hoyosella rhizosphaerae]GGC65717.1 TetR family transcriptional regulator [Hoyosella rhizosphaerae]